jgi:hypothetical protein
MSTENQNNQQTSNQQQNSGSTGGGSSSGAAQQSVEDIKGLEAAQQQREQQAQQGQQTATQAAPPPGGLSPEQIQALVKTAVGEVAQQHAPQEPPEVTMAKFEKAFNVYKFDPEKLARLGYTEDQIASVMPIYEDLRDGLVRQAVTMANYQMGLLREELTKAFQPALDVARSHLEERLKAEFLEANKDLIGYEPLLEEIKNRMVAQNRQFRSKEELFNTISTEARTIIDKVLKKGTNASGNGGGQQNTQTQQQSHRMSTVSAGGQGGAGAAATSGDKPGWLKALE